MCRNNRTFQKKGWECCILKGQGNAVKYENPLSRTPGDIDVWVNASKDNLISFVRDTYPDASISSHHIEYPIYNNVEIEVHFTPFYSIVLGHNKIISLFIEEHRNDQFHNPTTLIECDRSVNVPTNFFNIIHQMTHMQKHFFYGGLGLRHIVDYYYLLKDAAGDIYRHDICKLLRRLGLLRFSEAVMWVLKEYLGMEERYLITDCDARRGRLLLREIMEGGNFGMYDERGYRRIRPFSNTLSLIVRDVSMFWLFPKEVICAPISAVIRSHI